MPPAVRWLVVAALAVAVALPPVLVRVWPAAGSTVDPAEIADRVRAARDVPWSGEVVAQGALSIPLEDSTFGGLARLLGERTELRVWWRDREEWRVDRLRTTGESDQVRDGGLTVRWSYESGTARFNAWSPVRLPTDVDLVPGELAARMLGGVPDEQLSALPSRRIAGRSAVGVRVVPTDPRTTIRQVDVWADEASGLALRVDVYDASDRQVPVLSTAATAVDRGRPPASATSFEMSSGLQFSQTGSLDSAAAANAFAPFALPPQVGGLGRQGLDEAFGAVGVYGRGPTALVVLPLRPSVADALADQLRKARSSRESGRSIALEVGPLSVLLVRTDGGSFVLTGTVTPATLTTASVDLLDGVVVTRG